MRDLTVEDLLALLEREGGDKYGYEPVTQLAHALQTAALAAADGAGDALVVASLLHDIGHLPTKFTSDKDGRPFDDHHETVGGGLLSRLFPASVVEPVRLHVAAKRYLCTAEPHYLETLSAESVRSLERQGGPFTAAEARLFERQTFSEEAIQLRGWDDMAKVDGLIVPGLSTYSRLIRAIAL